MTKVLCSSTLRQLQRTGNPIRVGKYFDKSSR